MPKKLIETTIPLKVINKASIREKSIRHGHPSTLHLWWSRKPLATACAVLWASLVDDPSAHPEQFPTEELQVKERDRLFQIMSDLVVWENALDADVLKEAKIEILKSMGPELIEFLDPFAGGGSIPLEAQRLGLIAHAHDLNPVAVLINKAMIEIPGRFANEAPVNLESRQQMSGAEAYQGPAGLAEDVRYYGQWMKEEAFQRIGHLYPTVMLPDGSEATVIAWLWARTVECPNPACRAQVPLTSSFVLSSKKGNEAWVKPHYDGEAWTFRVQHKPITEEARAGTRPVNESGKAKKATFVCPVCNAGIVDGAYADEAASRFGFGAALMAVVCESGTGRLYTDADSAQMTALSRADDAWNMMEQNGAVSASPPCRGTFASNAQGRRYGFQVFDDYFTKRQLVMLTTFSNIVAEAQAKAAEDARKAGMTNSEEYGKAIATYLAIVVDRLADRNSSLCSWDISRDGVRNTFGRQAIPMVWDYTEANPFSNSSGCFNNMLDWVVKSVGQLPALPQGYAEQYPAQSRCDLRSVMISTDPPYYDNIDYADLSDYFYVWLRRSLRNVYPELFRRTVTPKDEELIATPYRHGGSKEKAKEFFEKGMYEACCRMYEEARDDIPVTIYYAYKQQDQKKSAGKKSSSGWETMLSAIMKAGFQLTGTWPIRTEMANRSTGQQTNALASSVVLVCRKRPEDAPIASRKQFAQELHEELRPALQALQSSNIAPVDMAQSAIGPGMSIFSKYSEVLSADGTPVDVRDALEIINQELDEYLSDQTRDLDNAARLCMDIYTQFGLEPMTFGEADVLARAKNTSVADLEHRKLLEAEKGKVRLMPREDIPHEPEDGDSVWLLTQQLTWALQSGGVAAAAQIIASPKCRQALEARDLAYRLFTVAEQKGWQAEALAYNSLVMAWPEIQEKATELKQAAGATQSSFLDDTEARE